MTGNTYFQIFLLIDVFIMGVLATIAIRHAYAHFRPAKHEPEPTNLPVTTIDPLPPVLRQRLLQTSQEQFQAVLKQSTDHMQQDLQTTTQRVNELVKRLATEIISDELEHYRVDLTRLHHQADIDISGIKKGLDEHQEELKAKMAQELEDEKQRLIKQIDTKLADAVGSFLLETLQHNIDLGEQGPYLMATLEEHKADFVKEVADEAQPSG